MARIASELATGLVLCVPSPELQIQPGDLIVKRYDLSDQDDNPVRSVDTFLVKAKRDDS